MVLSCAHPPFPSLSPSPISPVSSAASVASAAPPSISLASASVSPSPSFFSLLAARLVPSVLGCAVDTLTQALAWHADAIGLAEFASNGLARQCGPSFALGINGKTSQMCWCRGVSRRRCPLLLPDVPPFDIDQTACQIRFAIYVFESLYC